MTCWLPWRYSRSFPRFVPFPLEIDQHFIAAILTVIGFSMNDTVIVFDRIREDSRLLRGKTKGEIINKAVNETLSRTIMTSLTVFLTILILFLVGGEVTKGFAFAMLIGVSYRNLFFHFCSRSDPHGSGAKKTTGRCGYAFDNGGKAAGGYSEVEIVDG